MATTTVNPSTTASPSTTSTTTSIPPVTTTPEPSQKLLQLQKQLRDLTALLLETNDVLLSKQKDLASKNNTFVGYNDIYNYLNSTFDPTQQDINAARKTVDQYELRANIDYQNAISKYGKDSDEAKLEDQKRKYVQGLADKLSDENLPTTLEWLQNNYDDYLNNINSDYAAILATQQTMDEINQSITNVLNQILAEQLKINEEKFGLREAANRFGINALKGK